MAIRKILSLFNQKGEPNDRNFKKWIKTTTGLTPKNLAIYQQAFYHSSISVKKSGTIVSNERLEFLGDALLGAIVADYLFKMFPYRNEGFLTQMRSRIVNGQSLKDLALKFGFNHLLKASLSKDEKTKSSAYGDAFEAFIGAIYLDQGFNKTKQFVVTRIIRVHLDMDDLMSASLDFKSQLQIFCQRNRMTLEYRLVDEFRQNGQKLFVIEVWINGKSQTRFENHSKRLAEQKAAQITLEQLQLQNGEAPAR